MFERGIFGHRTPALFQPIVHIPLVILQPGQQERSDIHMSTSAVDLLPTLLHVTGQPLPTWTEGQILPPFADPIPDRNIYAVEAKYSDPHKPLNPVSVMLVKENYKLTCYAGYEVLGAAGNRFELYDLETDPEELNDLYLKQPAIAARLQQELLEALQQANQPYQD
jgi:arylsulfatase A-like enzyme